MRGRRQIVDLEVRNGLSSALKLYFKSANVSKAEFARRWKINPQMLYRYLNGTATPSTEVLAKLVRVPDLAIPFAQRVLRLEDFPLKSTPPKGMEVQLDLDFDQPLNLRLGGQSLTVAVVRRPNGRLEVTLGVTSAA